MRESPSTQGEPSTSASVCWISKFSLLLSHALNCHNFVQLLSLGQADCSGSPSQENTGQMVPSHVFQNGASLFQGYSLFLNLSALFLQMQVLIYASRTQYCSAALLIEFAMLGMSCPYWRLNSTSESRQQTPLWCNFCFSKCGWKIKSSGYNGLP